MKRTSIQFICVILIFALGATATPAGAEVFTVDSNGSGNYTTIQEAVNNVQTGDIIMVNPGVYRENVAVNKALTILPTPDFSGDSNRTYVIGAVSEKDVFDIYSNDVTIDGFYIIGGHSGVERDEVGINLEGVHNCSLINNYLVLNDVGISLKDSKGNYLDNNFVSLGKKGITLVGSNENIVSNNTVMTNSNGISLNNSMNNSIVNNSLYFDDVGINITGSSENSIYENSFSNFLDAMDDSKNIWNSSSKGNLWSNYTGQDVDRNGIGDTPYVINQTTGSIDYMPIVPLNNVENVSGNVSENASGNPSENMSSSTGM